MASREIMYPIVPILVEVVLAALDGQVLIVAVAPAMLDGVYGTKDIAVLLTGVYATVVGYWVLVGAR